MVKDKFNKVKEHLKNPRRRRRATIIFWSVVLLPVVSLFVLVTMTGMGIFGALPTFEELENPRSNIATELISSDGQNIGNFFIQNRSYVEYGELSPNLVAALVATEDARFYNHSGIDFMGLMRVAIRTLAMGDKGQGGGSTISQQLAKNLYPRDTANTTGIAKVGKLVVSKMKEWITAVMLEHNYTKEEIIVMYLNTVEYGSNAYGIKAAARTFFNKLPSELDVEEAAMLVGVVNAPTRYSPKRNPERAKNRRNTVIGRMADAGFISTASARDYSSKPIALDYHPISHNEGQATYFREMLRLYMTADRPNSSSYSNNWDYKTALKLWESDPLYGWCNKNNKADGTKYNLYKDGLKVYTTVNSKMQRYAEEALLEHMGGEIQPTFDKQRKARNTIFYNIDQQQIETILNSAMMQSERGRQMRNAGRSRAEIIEAFSKPTEMTLFTYKGERDTVLTPRDSIIYCKSILRSSFMAMDPTTGYILAYVGGPSFKYFKYDMVSQGRRQVGSTVKPFIYTFAFDNLRYTPCTLVPNERVTIETGSGDAWSPKEAGKVEYDGVMHPLRWGMSRSRNNYSAWIMKQSSPEAVTDLIHKMGISSYIDPVHAVCVGTPEVTLSEMVGAFSTYANRGVHTEPFFVTRIEDKQGNTLASFSPRTHDAISEQTAYTMLGMLKSVISEGTGGRLRYQFQISGEVGGKTGTTNNNADAWFIGVTPKIAGGAWVGGEDRATHLVNRGEGSVAALPIFGRFMTKVYADKSLGVTKDDKFMPPVGAVTYNCDEMNQSATATNQQRTVVDDEFFE